MIRSQSMELTRRSFTLGLGAAGAAAALGLPGAAPRAETPRRGGRLRAAMSTQSAADALDPAKFSAGIDIGRGYQFYNLLVRMDAALEPQPELAESFESNGDATRWTFKLRRGVTFANGKTLTAEDVRYSIQRHLIEEVGSSGKPQVEDVTEIKVDDADTISFTLKAPNADFPVNLADFHMFIVPDGTTDFSKAVGTGPFTLAEFQPGVRSVGLRNANYWKESRPYVDEVEWFAITDPNARLSALLAGDVHMIAELDPKAIAAVEQSGNAAVLSAKAGQYVDFVMMADRAPTEARDLRLAIKHLLDREQYLATVYKGFGMVANDHPISPADPFYCADLPVRAFDPDKARFHLKQAGLDGATIPLHTGDAPGPGAVDQALLLQQAAAQAGLTIDVKREPADGYWSAVWMQFPFHMAGWNMRPTADAMLRTAFKSTAPWNEAQWKREDFDQLLDGARAETDKAKRKQMYCDMQQMIHEDGGVGIACFMNYVDAAATTVKGHDPVPLGPLGGYQFAENVWLDV
jgi:peptide/nickel transport system substrate-binding protein